MTFLRPIAIGIALLVAQISASAAEIAVLRNGSQISFVRKEEINSTTTRLYLASGHVDMETADIASFEKDDTPVAMTDATSSADNAGLNPATSNGSGINVAAGTQPGRKKQSCRLQLQYP